MGSLGPLDSLAGIPLHSALENTGTGLVACDAAGRLTLLSPALQELFGIDYAPHHEDVIPEVLRLYHEDGATLMEPDEVPLARARAGEFVRDVVVAAANGNGDLVYLKCQGAPLTDEGGAVTGAVVLTQDVTAEFEATRRTEELRHRLVHTVNHEFRTPLAAMLGHLELMHEHHDDLPPDLARSLAAIERAGWRMRDIICAAADLIERQDELHQRGRLPDGAPRAS